jgi:hypothetical protein
MLLAIREDTHTNLVCPNNLHVPAVGRKNIYFKNVELILADITKQTNKKNICFGTI